MRLVSVVLSVAAIAVVAPTASAGHPQERQGFYAGLDIGLGGATETCGQCERGDRQWGFAGDLRLGWATGRHALWGAEAGYSRTEAFGATLTLYDVLLAVTVYPAADRGFFLKAGFGGVFTKRSYDFGAGTVEGDTNDGLAVMVGAGYDLRVGRNVSVTPGVTYRRTNSIEVGAGDVVSLNLQKYDLLAFSIGVTLH